MHEMRMFTAFDEIKVGLTYNAYSDAIKGFQNFGHFGTNNRREINHMEVKVDNPKILIK